MIQLHFVLDFQGNNRNHIDFYVLEREDANDQERELARHIEELHVSILETIQSQMPSQVEITRIGHTP